jgi:hypothetical protein
MTEEVPPQRRRQRCKSRHSIVAPSDQVVHRWPTLIFSSSSSRASATRTESQLSLSAIESTNVWMWRAAVPYNEMT